MREAECRGCLSSESDESRVCSTCDPIESDICDRLELCFESLIIIIVWSCVGSLSIDKREASEDSSDDVIPPFCDRCDDTSGRYDDSNFCIIRIPCGRRCLYRSGCIDHDICRRGRSNCYSSSGVLSLRTSHAICTRSNTDDKCSICGEFVQSKTIIS